MPATALRLIWGPQATEGRLNRRTWLVEGWAVEVSGSPLARARLSNRRSIGGGSMLILVVRLARLQSSTLLIISRTVPTMKDVDVVAVGDV